MKSWMMKIWLNQHAESSSIPDINVRQPEGASHVLSNELHPTEDNIRAMCSREFLENHSYIYTKSPLGVTSYTEGEELYDETYEFIPASQSTTSRENVQHSDEEIYDDFSASVPSYTQDEEAYEEVGEAIPASQGPTSIEGVQYSEIRVAFLYSEKKKESEDLSKDVQGESGYANAEVLSPFNRNSVLRGPLKRNRPSCILPYRMSTLCVDKSSKATDAATAFREGYLSPSKHDGSYQNTTGQQHKPIPANRTKLENEYDDVLWPCEETRMSSEGEMDGQNSFENKMYYCKPSISHSTQKPSRQVDSRSEEDKRTTEVPGETNYKEPSQYYKRNEGNLTQHGRLEDSVHYVTPSHPRPVEMVAGKTRSESMEDAHVEERLTEEAQQDNWTSEQGNWADGTCSIDRESNSIQMVNGEVVSGTEEVKEEERCMDEHAEVHNWKTGRKNRRIGACSTEVEPAHKCSRNECHLTCCGGQNTPKKGSFFRTQPSIPSIIIMDV